jgi:hypothetical protein
LALSLRVAHRGRPLIARPKLPALQNVTVKHVHVHEGGQAVVGVINNSGGKGRGRGGNAGRGHAKQPAALGYAPVAEMRGEDAVREPLPVAGGLGEA